MVELVEDIRFEDGTWVPTDDRTKELVDAVCACCSTPRRVFGRSASALDVERVALREAARRAGEDGRLPDLNLFYVLDGDPAALRGLPLIGQVHEMAPLAPPAPMEVATDQRLQHTDGALLADELDRAAAARSAGDTLVVPWALVDPASRAAAELAARRGVRIVTPDGEVRAGKSAPAARRSKLRARVTLDSVTLLAGGDELGTSELYIEGWIDDGTRRRLRIPEKGARTGVRRGLPEEFKVDLYDGVPLGDALIVHLEVWEEDLGRHSLIDPDDLIGVHERRFTAAERWGEGAHGDIRVETDDAACLVSYSIRVTAAS